MDPIEELLKKIGDSKSGPRGPRAGQLGKGPGVTVGEPYIPDSAVMVRPNSLPAGLAGEAAAAGGAIPWLKMLHDVGGVAAGVSMPTMTNDDEEAVLDRLLHPQKLETVQVKKHPADQLLEDLGVVLSDEGSPARARQSAGSLPAAAPAPAPEKALPSKLKQSLNRVKVSDASDEEQSKVNSLDDLRVKQREALRKQLQREMRGGK